MPDSPSAALNPPQQPRSRRTLERIVAAALSLLEAEGPDGVTVQAVVARAKSSVGSFYARFGGKDDLLQYLGERVWDEALARWNASIEAKAWSGMDLAQIIEGAVGLLVDIGGTRVGHLRDLDRMSGGGTAYERFRGHLVGSLETLLLERRAAMEHPRPELAVRLGLRAIMGVVEADLPAESAVSREELIEECRLLLLGYLAGSLDQGESEPVEFFDVWG